MPYGPMLDPGAFVKADFGRSGGQIVVNAPGFSAIGFF